MCVCVCVCVYLSLSFQSVLVVGGYAYVGGYVANNTFVAVDLNGLACAVEAHVGQLMK